MDTINTQGVGHFGTGLIHALDPIGRLYYRQLLKLMETQPISLPYGGWAHPFFRHRKAVQICDHKLGELDLDLIEWGHSQGGLQAAAHSFRPQSRTRVLFCLATPLNGSKAADLIQPIRHLPRWMRLSLDGIVEMMTGSESLEHLHNKVRARMADPDFELPHVVLVADQHDLLVSVESQLHWVEGYPADKLHRALMVNGDVTPFPGIEIIPTPRHLDNHALMVLSRELQAYVVNKLLDIADSLAA